MISTEPEARPKKARPARGRPASKHARTLPWRVATWGGLALLFVLSLLPGKWDVDVDFAEDIHHFAAYLLLGIAAGATYPKHRPGWALALVVVAGGFEVLQHFSPGRETTWNDFLSGTAGALLGVSVASAWHSLIVRGSADSGGDRPG